MFNYKSKIRKRAACRAEAARSERLVIEGVDVKWRIEAFRKARKVSVESVDVVFDSDEVKFGVVEFAEARMADEVVEMFGRDVENLIVVVAGRDSSDECNCCVRETFGKKLQSDGDREWFVEFDRISFVRSKLWIVVAVFVACEIVCVLHERPQSDFRITCFVNSLIISCLL